MEVLIVSREVIARISGRLKHCDMLINKLLMIVNQLLNIVEIMLFPKNGENILLNAEIDPVDIVPGISVLHVDV